MHLAKSSWPTRPPYLRRPENGWLWDCVALPDFQHTQMALEVAGMLDARNVAVCIDEPASTHYDVSPATWVDFLRHTCQCARSKCVVRVEEAPDCSGGKREAFVQGIRMAPIRLGDDAQMREF